ncbi:MAG: hypothetical protein Q9191_006732 [Dirinaria sp. TL-2023a]
MADHPIPLILLKTPTSAHDSYTSHFAPHAPTSNPSPSYSYKPTYIPVLTHTPVLSSLLPLLRLPAPLSLYSALVFTSARAVDAFASALSSLSSTTSPEAEAEAEALLHYNGTLYAVGPATASSLRTSIPPYLPHAKIHGEEAGSGEALAEIMLQDIESGGLTRGGGGGEEEVLFLCGEKHRDVIPQRLGAAGWKVREMVVYRTDVREAFEQDLLARLREMDDRVGVRWIVLFSAAGGDAIVNALGEGGGSRNGGTRTFVACIGPTTAEYMRRQFGFEVHVVAKKPSPEGLRAGIEKFMMEVGITPDFEK